jgi:hypothetical protein
MPEGYEGRHVVGINPHWRRIWSYGLPIFVIVQDPDDGDLYFGNLARMADLARPDERKIPLYPDLRLTPNGLDRFMRAARAEAREPIPPAEITDGEVPQFIRYPDGTIGPSPQALDVTRRQTLGRAHRLVLQP